MGFSLSFRWASNREEYDSVFKALHPSVWIFIHSRPDFAIILSHRVGLHSGQNIQWSILSLSTITSEDLTSHDIAAVISDFKSFSNCEVSEISVFHWVSFFNSG